MTLKIYGFPSGCNIAPLPTNAGLFQAQVHSISRTLAQPVRLHPQITTLYTAPPPPLLFPPPPTPTGSLSGGARSELREGSIAARRNVLCSDAGT